MDTMTFFSDVWENLRGYYDGLVGIFPQLILALLVLLAFYFAARSLRKAVLRRVLPRTDDPLLTHFLARVAQISLMIVGLIVVLRILGLQGLAGGLLASAGIGAFAVGFALKDIGENFIAGILLAFNRPFNVGDVVEISGVEGKVVGLNLRNVHLRTGDGRDVFIPTASVIRNPLTNITIDNDLRFDFTVGLDYGSDYGRAIEIILATLKEQPNIMQTPRAPFVMVRQLGPSTLDLGVFYWIDAFKPGVSGAKVKNQAVFQVLQNLMAAGYYLPGNVVELKNYQEGTLAWEGSPSGKTA